MSAGLTDRATITIDFDHHSAEAIHERRKLIERVRDYPIFYTEHHGGYWVVTTIELIRQVYNDPATFSSARDEHGRGGVTIPETGMQLSFVETDPPLHREMRKLVVPKFNRRALESLRPLMRRWATEAVEQAIEQQDFDLVHMAAHVPSSLMIDYFGFADDVKAEFLELIEHLLSLQNSMLPGAELPDEAEVLKGMESLARLQASVAELLEDRRRNPADDIATHLVRDTELNLNAEDLFLLCLVLYIGGTENIIAFFTNMLVYVAEHPELRAELIADPDKVPAAIEELQRLSSTATGLARTVIRDTELNGVPLRKGDRIMGFIPAANHDPAIFPDPETFRFDRDNIQENVAFGFGAHRCIGVTLTRMEADVLLREVLQRMPNYTVDRTRSRRVPDAHITHGWESIAARANT